MEGTRFHRTTIYEWGIGVSGLLMAIYYLPPLFHQSIYITVFLFVLAVLLEVFPVPLGKVHSSLLIAMPVAVTISYGVEEAIWLMIVAELLFPWIRRVGIKSSVRIFNAGQYAISAWVMAKVVHVLHGTSAVVLSDWRTYLVVVVGYACFVAVNHTLIHFLQVLRGKFDTSDIVHLLAGEGINVLISLPFALLMISMAPEHPLIAPTVMLPIILLGQTIGLYRRTSVMHQVYRVTGQLTSEFDEGRIAQSVAETAKKLTYADSVSVLLADPNGAGNLFFPAAMHPPEEAAGSSSLAAIRLGEGAIGQALRSKQSTYIPDIRKCEAASVAERVGPYLSIAVLPMPSRQTVLGAIICYSRRPYAFSELLEQAQSLSKQVAVLVENARLYQALQEQSWRDAATGLYNYRFFYEALARHVHQAEYNETSVSVVVIDVDYFKKFNDTYGHLAGDKVLHSLGELMNEMAGPEVIVARYGGEEFGLIFPYDTDETWMRAEKIRTAVARHVVEYDGYQLQGITVSIGIASYPEHGTTDRDLLLKADSAMYWGAKQRGRNHTALYSPEFDAQLFVDELTGLYTHHFVTIRAREEILRGVQQWGAICINVDHFNRVNEVFGFAIGDRALREMSVVIKEGVRQTELTSRFAGDEFLVLLPNVSKLELDQIAERITKSVAVHRFEITPNVTLSLRMRQISVALSDVHDVTSLFDQVGRSFASLRRVTGESLA